MQLKTAAARTTRARAAYEAFGDDALAFDQLSEETRERWGLVSDAVLAASGNILRQNAEEAGRAGMIEVAGKTYMRTPKGELRPLSMIAAQKQLEDEMVRKIIFYAQTLSAEVSRFKGHTFADTNAHQSLLEQEYGAKAGGVKGNVTFSTVDDTQSVIVKIADQITFGPELQSAKRLVDECLVEWGAESHEALRALVNRVFAVEKQGQINRNELFSLLAMRIEDERWARAMEAIRDSIRVVGTKEYLNFRVRDERGAWSKIVIDLAAA